MDLERGKIGEYLTLQRLLRKEHLPPGAAELGYVMAETVDNLPLSLLQAKKLLEQGVVKRVAIPDPWLPFIYGYPGPDYCKEIFLYAGVNKDKIIMISPETYVPGMNTQTELGFVAAYLKEINASKNLVIIAPWFHSLRAYLTALSEIKKAGLEMMVYISSVSLDPHEVVAHSQGIQKGTRRRIFYTEIEKCERYKNLIPIEGAREIFKNQRVY